MLATVKARNNHMGLPFRLDANTTVNPRQNKAFAMPTNHSPILLGQAQPSSHGDLSGNFNVPLGQLRVFMNGLLSETEKPVNALEGYLFRVFHFYRSSCMTTQ